MESKKIIFNVICGNIGEELFGLSEEEINKEEYRQTIKNIIDNIEMETIEVKDMEDKKKLKDAIDIIIENVDMPIHELKIEVRRFICMLIEEYKNL